MNSKPMVGLFGTCGTSTWRDGIIEYLKFYGIPYFNPLRADWKHEYIAEENKHLNEDDIVIFVVTNETTGFGSLGEIGFSFLNAKKTNQILIVMIDKDCIDPKADAKALKESVNTRALVKTKVMNNIDGITTFYADDLEQIERIIFSLTNIPLK